MLPGFLEGQRYTYNYQSELIHSIPRSSGKALGLRMNSQVHADFFKNTGMQITVSFFLLNMCLLCVFYKICRDKSKGITWHNNVHDTLRHSLLWVSSTVLNAMKQRGPLCYVAASIILHVIRQYRSYIIALFSMHNYIVDNETHHGSRAFLSLAWFWRNPERLCMN